MFTFEVFLKSQSMGFGKVLQISIRLFLDKPKVFVFLSLLALVYHHVTSSSSVLGNFFIV